MIRRSIGIPLLVSTLLIGCATTPQQSVKLSATVGQDLATMHERHRELVVLLFERMRQDVDRFVDRTYAPSQLKTLIDSQQALADSTNPNDRKRSLVTALREGSAADASAQSRDMMTLAMGKLLSAVAADVAKMRLELTEPIDRQQASVLKELDESYQQLSYANAVVTAHLASIVAVEEAQDEALEALGAQAGFRERIGEELAKASDQIGKIVSSAEGVDSKLTDLTEKSEQIKAAVSEIGKHD